MTSRDSDIDWQEQAWRYYELVGELAYYASWRAASASRVKLVASDIGEDGLPTGSTENVRVQEIVQAIGGGAAGQSQMLNRLTLFLTIPGEGYTAMIVRDPSREKNADDSPLDPDQIGDPLAEDWFAFSRDEITKGGTNDLIFTLPDGKKHSFDKDVDLLFRIWNQHPRFASEANSPVRSARVPLNEIVQSSLTIDNASKSRLVGNGVVFVPQEMSLPQQRQSPTAIGSDEVDSVEPDAVQRQSSVQDLQDLLYEVGTTAIKDPNSMAAYLPVFASVPGEWTKNVNHLKFESTIPETALSTREKALIRLARSLDVAPERLLGMGTNSNHWSAWAIGEDDVKIHIVPVIETITQAFTQFILRPALEKEGLDPAAFCVHHDSTDLTQDPDKRDEAKDAHAVGAITSKALRKHFGLEDEDGYDLTTIEGWRELAADKAAADPTLIPTLAPLIKALEGTVFEEPEPEPAELEPAPEAEAEPVVEAEPEEPDSQEPTDGPA